MNVIIIKPNSPTWDKIWERLGSHPINENIAEPTVAFNEGECWQYMPTLEKDGKCISEFRHRYHPRTNNRANIAFEHEEPIPDEDIEVKRPIR